MVQLENGLYVSKITKLYSAYRIKIRDRECRDVLVETWWKRYRFCLCQK